MTNVLLLIIAVLLFARIVLQIKQGKRAVEKGYASAYGVRKVAVVAKSADELYDRLCENGNTATTSLYQSSRTRASFTLLCHARG